MNHLTEEQFTAAYYGEIDSSSRLHLNKCSECSAEYERLKQLLEDLREYPVPERGPSWEGELWERLAVPLQAQAPKAGVPWWRSSRRWWILAPAFAAVVTIAFIAGMLTEHQRVRQQPTGHGSERVLLMAIGDHLDRSQIVLAELAHAPPAGIDLSDEREAARNLLTDNRLLRQTATRSGELTSAAVLDELERILLDIANSPSGIGDSDLQAIQRRIESDGLLLKVRIISTNIRHKGMKL